MRKHRATVTMLQRVYMAKQLCDTVQLDLNFKNARVCNCTRTTRAEKYSLRARVRTGDW